MSIQDERGLLNNDTRNRPELTEQITGCADDAPVQFVVLLRVRIWTGGRAVNILSQHAKALGE
jgi:hypothetical protein